MLKSFKEFINEEKLGKYAAQLDKGKTSGARNFYRIETDKDHNQIFADLEKVLSDAEYHEGPTTHSSKGHLTFTDEDGKKGIVVVKPSSASKKADAKTTAMQERGSAWIMRRAINDNVKYSDWKDILNDPRYPELQKLYPDISDDWLKNYYAQQERMLKEFANVQFSEYNRDGGFMDYITDLVKGMGVSKKDTWNPADIWLIKSQSEVMKRINDAMTSSPTRTIAELNAVMRQLFKERKLIGISLKLVSGKQAKYEEVNTSDGFDLGNDYKFNLENVVAKFGFSGDKFASQDSVVTVSSNNATVKFQIKANDTNKFSNLKWEGTQKGASKARLGKAPVDMVAAILADEGIQFRNDWKKYVNTLADFKRNRRLYADMFSRVKGKVKTDISSKKDFIDAMEMAFASSNKKNHMVANSKLMQLSFLDAILLNQSSLVDQIFTDLVFVSMKKGPKFGPFGKLY